MSTRKSHVLALILLLATTATCWAQERRASIWSHVNDSSCWTILHPFSSEPDDGGADRGLPFGYHLRQYGPSHQAEWSIKIAATAKAEILQVLVSDQEYAYFILISAGSLSVSGMEISSVGRRRLIVISVDLLDGSPEWVVEIEESDTMFLPSLSLTEDAQLTMTVVFPVGSFGLVPDSDQPTSQPFRFARLVFSQNGMPETLQYFSFDQPTERRGINSCRSKALNMYPLSLKIHRTTPYVRNTFLGLPSAEIGPSCSIPVPPPVSFITETDDSLDDTDSGGT